MGLFDRLADLLGSSQRHIADLSRAEGQAARRGDESKAAYYGRLRATEEGRASDLQRQIDKGEGR